MDSEQLLNPVPAEDKAEKMRGFKKACVKVGLAMLIFFASTDIASIILALVLPSFKDTELYMPLRMGITAIFAYIIPIIAAKIIFGVKLSQFKTEYYKKPKYMGAALTLLPACYALSMIINWLTQLISMFFTNSSVNETAQTLTESIMPADMESAVVLFLYLTICAPVFEELFFRGFLLNALRPYGNGVAIFLTGFLFGIFHGNYIQCFFAIGFGIALAYIAIHTGSIITGMVMHAIVNALAGTIYLFMGSEDVRKYIAAAQNGVYLQPTPIVQVLSVYLYVLWAFVIISVIVLIVKLRKIRKYSVPKVWEGVSSAKRYAVFFTRISVIIMLVFVIDTFTFNLIPRGGFALISLIFKL